MAKKEETGTGRWNSALGHKSKLALQHAQQANAVGPRGNSRNSKRTPGQLANSQSGKCKGCGALTRGTKTPLATRAIEKCDFYLRGLKHFSIHTDHKPLVGLMKKELHDIPNDRLVRMRERLIPYNFSTTWVEGKLNVIADALSRSPVSKAEQNAHERRHDILTCQFLSQLAPCHDLVVAGQQDKEYCSIVRLIEQGVSHKAVPGDLQAFKPSWEKLSLLGGPTQKLVIYNGNRIVVPHTCRRDILLKLHSSHCGQSKMLEYAQQLYFWPGMTLDVRQLVDTCDSCQELYVLPGHFLEPRRSRTNHTSCTYVTCER